MNKLRLGMFVLLVLAGASALQAQCPPGLPQATTCHAGMDTNGAFFLIAVPANYNHRLLLWNHGYSLAPPGKLGAEDLSPLGPLLLQLGFAVAAKPSCSSSGPRGLRSSAPNLPGGARL